MNKRKIINDPVYGFISIKTDLIFDLLEHRYFQRLRYIKQLGMTHLVYPGALHTRFHHALGAMHLMSTAIETLCEKGVDISGDEKEALMIAILLHDIGHGPFSHALEHTLVEDVSHEDISELLMDRLNDEFGGRLTTAISIFRDTYHKRFMHQLVSSQLDMDRLDYLNRDSFFTGVSEGVISSERIIKMLNVRDDHVVVEEKGIYSVEKFLVARRLMYWQVYLHKTVIAGEYMLVKILKRARELVLKGHSLFATPALNHFLVKNVSKDEFINEDHHIETFTKLDDTDILSAVKVWADDADFVLSRLCRDFVNRKLFHVDLTSERPEKQFIRSLVEKAMHQYNISKHDAQYFVFDDSIINSAYRVGDGNIRIAMKNGAVKDIAAASDNSSLEALSKTVKKYLVCYSRDLRGS